MNRLLLLVLLLLGLHPEIWAQCTPTPNSGADFRAYDAATGLELPFYLCVGRPVRLRDVSGKGLNPAQIYYRQASTIVCTGFVDTVTTFTPTVPGVLVVTQNTQGAQGGTQGIIASKTYEVKSTPAPTFTLTTCTPGVVQVTVTDTNYDQYLVQVGNAAPVSAARNATVTFPAPGPYTVRVEGRYNQTGICTGTATQSFTPVPAPQRPLLRSLTVQGNAAEFQFDALQPEYQYSLQVADAAVPGGYRTVAPIAGTFRSFTLTTATLPGCYRLLLQDKCQPAVVSLASPDICSLTLTGTSPNGRNLLTWSPNEPGSYTLTRITGTTTTTLPVPAGTTQYLDTAVTCGTTYRYRLTRTAGATTSISEEISVTTTAGAAPVAPLLTATFNLRNQVELTAVVPRSPGGGQLTYLRNGQELRATTARFVRDSLVTPNLTEPLCYAARFQDACGNRSADSAPVCPVLLEARADNDEGTRIRLTWTAFRGPAASAPVSYRVITLSPTNTELSRVPVSGLTYLDLQPPQDQQAVRYRVEATGGGLPASSPSYSNVVSVARLVKVFVPTAFTPNGDGLNDVLELKGRFLDNFRFTVLDRNGQQVFQATTRTQTWDGRIGSAPPVPGAYAWRFEATDQAGKRLVQHGTVTIIK
ncbi:gliding motility-associated C-terminal domain-containing protein [Hymenobacter endophyticus]|uniref:Gliding motility-associated C-terminal domain-containing protein n=1 Tax=Hymenobacter endophyticus TaxID=3076335 RepID=A0ABU3TCK7_9BACT|nr:gliding motility-associated C-terminal domain-containing protein [Hymenobacter endophyticus]MDU0369074.1 gliding motility-associated C-terminal domain-containing protein [Hymenobacter endophyticus]